MTDESQGPQAEELRDRWIEVLLDNAARPQDHSDRITRAMRQLETAENAELATATTRKPPRYLRWGAMATAAVVLLTVAFLVSGSGTPSAMAAIERSLDVAAQPNPRKYLLQVEFWGVMGKTVTIDNDLYVQGNDRFALRHPGLLPGTSFWLGRDGVEAWVLPAFGPVLQGDKEILSRWLNSHKEMDTPYLHVRTMLTRMLSRGYRLESLEDERLVLADGMLVECRHVRAERTYDKQSDLPLTIELWASRESGMAMKLVAKWETSGVEVGRKSVVLTFQSDEPALPENWFTARAHYEGVRPVRRVDAASPVRQDADQQDADQQDGDQQNAAQQDADEPRF